MARHRINDAELGDAEEVLFRAIVESVGERSKGVQEEFNRGHRHQLGLSVKTWKCGSVEVRKCGSVRLQCDSVYTYVRFSVYM